MRKQFILLLVLACWGAGTWGAVPHEKKYADYVNPLMGTLSEIQLSTGNTYPAIARPCTESIGRFGSKANLHEFALNLILEPLQFRRMRPFAVKGFNERTEMSFHTVKHRKALFL